MIRVVVDTNVYIAAILSPAGAPGAVLEAIRDGRVEAIASPRLLDELERALRYPKLAPFVPGDEVDTVVTIIRSLCFLADDPAVVERASRDPADDFIVALARATAALAIVTGDRDLLRIEGLEPPAISPRAFVDALDAPPGASRG